MECPKCKNELIQGKASVHGTPIGFLCVGFSWQHLWFSSSQTKEDVIIESGDETDAYRCNACGLVIVDSKKDRRDNRDDGRFYTIT